MQHLMITHVDALTGRSILEAPAANGPALPDLPGLVIELANESAWPTAVPIFYARCDEGADPNTPGVLAVLTEEQYRQAIGAELAARIKREEKEASDAIQRHLDRTAQAHGYDNIRSAALRASLPNSPYYSDGVLFGEWMDACWFKSFQIQTAVAAGEREKPTIAELIAELPPLPELNR